MAVKPILFSGPMVQALLDGRKTQTRRRAKPKWVEGANPSFTGWQAERSTANNWLLKCSDIGARIKLPYGAGDRLWVREAHALLPRTAYRMSIGTGTIDQREHPTDGYSAAVFRQGFDRSGRLQWRPSIHMPRWASRLTLTVTDVRVERLQDMTNADCVNEGIERLGNPDGFRDYSTDDPSARLAMRPSFQSLWDSLNAKRGFGWEANPWVTATTFTVHRCNTDELADG